MLLLQYFPTYFVARYTFRVLLFHLLFVYLIKRYGYESGRNVDLEKGNRETCWFQRKSNLKILDVEGENLSRIQRGVWSSTQTRRICDWHYSYLDFLRISITVWRSVTTEIMRAALDKKKWLPLKFDGQRNYPFEIMISLNLNNFNSLIALKTIGFIYSWFILFMN